MFVIEGIKTSVPLHQRIMHDTEFINGKIHTRFMDKFLAD